MFPSDPSKSPSPHSARVWLAIAFLLPNLITLGGGFIYDDLPLLAEDETMHSLSGIGEIWTEPFWPDRPILTLYRPVTKTIWMLVWVAGGGSPVPFHLLNLALGAAVVLLLHAYLRELDVSPRASFLTAFLFALFPIHVEAVAPVFGTAELLAATLGLGGLILHHRGHRAVGLILFALAVYSKESAAALAAIGFLAAPRPKMRYWPDGVAAAAVIISILIVRANVGAPAVGIPVADNPTTLQSPFWRFMSALWVQCLYLWKTIVPINLSAEYSYQQISLVVRMSDPRALAGIAFFLGSAWIVWKKKVYAPGVITWWVLFLPAANLLYPIGTIMAERLAYLPSAGAALVLGTWLSRRKWTQRERTLFTVLLLVFAIYGTRTVMRNLVWTDTERFYAALVANAPESARAHFGRGVYLASQDRDDEALEEYERATEILPSFADAHFNRANALVRLGRTQEAIEAYKKVIRLAPGQTPAEQNMMILLSGGEIETRTREVD